MELGAIVAAATLALLAVAHSALGETGFIRPLLAADWDLSEVPRWAADRLTRGAWHLTSLAWVGLAAVALGVRPLLAVGLAGILSGLAMFVALREHFAWPLFGLAGVAALHADGSLTAGPLRLATITTAVAVAAVGVVHVYWAFGGRAGYEVALPETADGEPTFRPGPMTTLAVAAALFTLTGLLAWRATGADHWIAVAGPAVAAAVLAVRAVGDGRQAGFSKTDRSTRFALADDRVFTPLCVLLAFGSGAAVLL